MSTKDSTHPNGHDSKVDPFDMDEREERLFRSLDFDNDQAMLPRDFERVLAQIGLGRNDRRLQESMTALETYIEKIRPPEDEDEKLKIPLGAFCQAVRPNILLIERALQGRMVIPDFTGFCQNITELYEAARSNRSGAPADYIPVLDLAEPEVDQFGLSLCTVDGQRFSRGDSDRYFSVQSTCKPVNYCLALEEHGPETVHRYIGHEPSGVSFNELALNEDNQPHNPMINAGAIMSSALIGSKGPDGAAVSEQRLEHRGKSARRFDSVMARWCDLCGGEAPRFSTSVFLSERETADRNFALAYFMREMRAFPDGIDLEDVLEFYFQCCSIEVTTAMMSVLAATFASGGICPVTGKRVFKTETVRHCLSLMSSCGMYDFSGEFAFTIGLPAKSGVSGAIMVVIPNVMGFCTWSPRLDKVGNSMRGLDFCRRLVERFNFHNYDDLTGNSGKKDPRLNPIQVKARQVNEMILAASKGDLGAIEDQLARGSSVNCRDYDLRTPLHLAAAENQLSVVRYFIEEARRDGSSFTLSPKDRWGGTPLDDAYLHGHDEIIKTLENAGARRGEVSRTHNQFAPSERPLAVVDSLKTGELIWAASLGDLEAIRRLIAQGVPLEAADYDHRTPMHLACAEGHKQVVSLLLAQGARVNPADRWGNTPIDDAIRHGQDEIAELLVVHGGRRRNDSGRSTAKDSHRKAA